MDYICSHNIQARPLTRYRMYWIFVVNGRKDKGFIDQELNIQLADAGIEYEVYHTKSEGDATRFVRIYCDFHPDDEVCFVACGGNGTLSEVANGVVGTRNKSLAMLAYGATSSFSCYFPGRDFRSVKDLVAGETMKSDIIKCNNEYSINVANFGFDSMCGYFGDLYIQEGKSKPYLRGTLRALLFNRVNNFRIIVDGKRMSRGLTMMCAVANSKYYGEFYKCAPNAVIDDGYFDVVVARFCPLIVFLLLFNKFKNGTYVDSKLARLVFKFRKARHIEASSKDLIYLCVDGETTASRYFDIELLDKAVTLRIPALKTK